MRDLCALSSLEPVLSSLVGVGDPLTDAEKENMISDVARRVSQELLGEGMINSAAQSLEASAYEINNRIKDPALRNESIFSGMMRE